MREIFVDNTDGNSDWIKVQEKREVRKNKHDKEVKKMFKEAQKYFDSVEDKENLSK